MPAPYRLLACDIDGTLLDETSALRPETVRAVRRAAEAGLRVVLCSGRSYRQAKPFADALGLVEPLIVVGGAMVRHSVTAEIWEMRTFPSPGVAARLVRLITAERLAVLATVHGHPEGEYLVLRGEPADAFDEPRMRAHPGIFHFVGSAEELDLTHALRVTVNATPGHFAAVRAAMETELAGQVRHHVIHAPDVKYPLMEIFPPAVHKWTAVESVAGRFGVSVAEIIAVGDDANDLEMVRGAGLGVAMGNAIPELRAAADRVIGRHSENGLARFLDEVIAPLSP